LVSIISSNFILHPVWELLDSSMLILSR